MLVDSASQHKQYLLAPAGKGTTLCLFFASTGYPAPQVGEGRGLYGIGTVEGLP